MNEGINVLSLFDGMSCGQIALNKLGIKVNNYFASEIDKFAISVTQKNFPETQQIGNVEHVSYKEHGQLVWGEPNTDTEPRGYTDTKIDLVYGGSPCQSFSNAGDGTGFDGKSKLFWEFVRILKEVKPKYFLLENVKMKQEWKDIITKEMGVEPILIDSRLMSAQKRQRLYWTNIPNIEIPKDKNILLKDVMLPLTDPRLELKRPSEKRIAYVQRKFDKGWLKELYKDVNTQKSDCLVASMYKQLQEFIWMDESGEKRFFSPLECENIQTIYQNYTSEGLDEKGNIKKISNTQRYKMIGNGWTIDVIAHIFKNMIL